MKKVKNILRFSVKFILMLCLFITGYLGLAQLFKYVTVNNDFNPNEKGIEVFVSSNGIHTDIIIPARHGGFDWFEFLDSSEFILEEKPEYLSFGWGDKGFFLETPTWDDLTAFVAVRAILVPSETAIHVTYCSTRPEDEGSYRRIKVQSEDLVTLNEFILETFDVDMHGQAQLIDCCRYNQVNDNFFEANGSYHAFNTCNNWTNRCLKKLGQNIAVGTFCLWCFS